MQTFKRRAAAYMVGGLTLAMLVAFVTLDLQAMDRESPRTHLVIDIVHTQGMAARLLLASE